MTRIEIDTKTAEQINVSAGPIELVDASGRTIGVVRRSPTVDEIDRAKRRASRGGETLTWEQLQQRVESEVGR